GCPGAATGARLQQPWTAGQCTVLPTSFGIMILMIDLDTVQLVIMGKGLQHARRQQVLPPTAPRMGNHCGTTCLGKQTNPPFQVDRVARHMRRTSVSQEAVECLLSILNMASRDQRVGNMGAADGGTVPYLSHNLRFADRPAKCGQLPQPPGEPTQPAITDSSHLR